MALSQGLGGFRAQPVAPETGAGERLPSGLEQQLAARTLRLVSDDLSDAADDLDPEESDGKKPSYLRGDFGANLLDPEQVDRAVTESERMRIASDLLRGIEADKQSRKDWEKMAEHAILFLGLIYEEASGEPSSQGSISKVWATLMLEAALGFWANAHAEFLPADGPVKIRDDKPSGDLDEQARTDRDRDEIAEDFERDYNHYLLTGDKQYQRDFSRMLWSLGPIGTEFRKIYVNPLRRMPVSEWVKSANLIISNEAADISTAGRVTERIPMRHSDVKRLQWMGHWLDIPLVQPHSEPTDLEKKAGQVEGIKKTIELPADHPHEILECYAERDLEGFEHEEDGRLTGLPLPYRFSIDKDSRQLLEIRRNWKEDDEDFRPRQRYVMFGMVPGFGLYYLGFTHLLGNTERAATALTREMIDVGMLSIFPHYLAEKGALPRGTTQIRLSPMGVTEVDTQLKKAVRDALEPVPVKPLDQNVLALLEKLERNGRNVSGKLEIPVGEGTANIPVGTMIAIVEQGTKVMLAVHKGLHISRAEELQLLRELIAEDPSVLARFSKSKREWLAEEFQDLDLVPSSDPNTPSHVHRLMRGTGIAQLSEMFSDLSNRPVIFKDLLHMLQVPDPARYMLPPGSQQAPQGPSPQEIAAQAKIMAAQIQSQSKAQDSAIQQQVAAADRVSKERVAMAGEQTERIKAEGALQSDMLKMHDSAAERQMDFHIASQQQAHERSEGQAQRSHEQGIAAQQQMHEATEGSQQRAADKEQASLSKPTPKRKI